MLRSFRVRLTALLVTVVIIPTGVVGYLGYHSSSVAIKDDAIRKVGQIAGFKRHFLLLRLRSQNARAHEFLLAMHAACEKKDIVDRKCVEALLESYMKVEKITTAEVRHRGDLHLLVGPDAAALSDHPPLAPGQLAQFYRMNEGKPYYLVESQGEFPDVTITVRYEMEFINEIFASAMDDLGKSGETFLADAQGFFITPPKYHGHSGESHPIEAAPMKICLSGQNDVILAGDYRPEPVIHGFRFMPEIGGGCIMAHVQQDEAFAPAMAFTRYLFWSGLIFVTLAVMVALVISHYFSKSVTVPLRRLVKRVKEAEEGDLDSSVPAGGPSEVESLGRGFECLLDAHRKSLDVREDFVAIVSHDLKNPISALGMQISMIEAMAARLPNNVGIGIIDQIAPIRRTIQRMVELIDNVLDLTNIKSGHFKIVPVAQDPRPLIDELLETFQPLVARKRIQLHCELPREGIIATFDRDRIFQTLSNFLGNALRFTPTDGAITVNLKVQNNGASGQLCFMVSDTGPGVPIDQREHVFDRYYQLERKGRGVGAGLGLYISKEIVTAHGGKIWVESNGGGQGASFFFCIPLNGRKVLSVEQPPSDQKLSASN